MTLTVKQWTNDTKEDLQNIENKFDKLSHVRNLLSRAEKELELILNGRDIVGKLTNTSKENRIKDVENSIKAYRKIRKEIEAIVYK